MSDFIPIYTQIDFWLLSTIATVSMFSFMGFFCVICLCVLYSTPPFYFKKTCLVLGLLSLPFIVMMFIVTYNSTFGFTDWTIFVNMFKPQISGCVGP